ncbi:MAG: hypothetical protein LBC40_00200 [Dysgonamonadaceae bacterium]|jgi:hypothetical protein|nr:hypothetical protein [Dysgonamonadaceae bacterium]
MLPNKVNITTVKARIETFFREETWKEVLVFLLFLALSLGFWVMQSLQQISETTVDVPVAYTNLPADIAVNGHLPSRIEVKVQDMGSAFLKYAVSDKIPAIEIDLQELHPQNHLYTVSSKYLETECQNRLPVSAKISAFSPSTIVIHYVPLKKKTVPVIFNGTIEPASGFMATQDVTLTPSEVSIFGSKEKLDSIAGIFTEKKNWSNLKGNIHARLKLQAITGVKMSDKQVDVFLPVEEYTEKVLEIPIISKDFPANYRLRTFPATIRISCLLPLSRYKDIKAEDFEAAVFYNEVSKSSVSTVPVIITRKPEFMNNYRHSPEQVEYLIEQIQ